MVAAGQTYIINPNLLAFPGLFLGQLLLSLEILRFINGRELGFGNTSRGMLGWNKPQVRGRLGAASGMKEDKRDLWLSEEKRKPKAVYVHFLQ